MGYDMSWVREPEPVRTLYSKLDTLDGDGGENGGAYMDTIREWSDARTTAGSYFCINIWGMATMRAIMALCGVLDTEATHPPFPDADLNSLEEEEAYALKVEPILRTRSPKEGQVPAFKFSSNDGWIVCPDECRCVAMFLNRKGQASVDQLVGKVTSWGDPYISDIQAWRKNVEDFATFCTRAAEEGDGFRVW